MPNKFKDTPNLNNPEVSLNEAVGNIEAGKKEIPMTPEELGKIEVEGGKEEKPELSPEEQMGQLLEGTADKEEEITRLAKSIADTKTKLNVAREKLGLSPSEEEPPSTLSARGRLEKLQTEKEELERQKEELISQQEKERLIREEKEKILQEKIDELRTKIEIKDDERDLVRTFKSSSTGERKAYREGRQVEESFLETEPSKSVLIFFKEGKIDRIIAGPEADVDKIIEAFIKNDEFEKSLTQEAEQRVEERLAEEKGKLEEAEQKPEEKPAEEKLEEKPKILEDETPAEELKQGPSVVEGGNIENLKA